MEIRILEADANRRGDLFGERMGDVLLALGYDDFRFNVHKAGREVDIQADHRTEKRRAVAECKATRDTIGGDDLNKFYGALDVERRKAGDDVDVQGYFMSLAGFKETAIEQEVDAGEDRFVLLDGEKIAEQLVRGHIVVTLTSAAAAAGSLNPGTDGASFEGDADLVGHQFGWFWIVYFATGHERTHYAVIHADGQPPAAALVDAVVLADASVDGPLAGLTRMQPGEPARDSATEDEVYQRYVRYLQSEFGNITLEGLPADQEVGARQIRVESLFVPMRVQRVAGGSSAGDEISTSDVSLGFEERLFEAEPQAFGAVLASEDRVALLAGPGGGKSTLLKRLATAYSNPERHATGDDELPDRQWLPLVIRCRQLGELAHRPISEVLASIPERAEMPELAEGFGRLVQDALRRGSVLLLIDGLDEIADDRARVAFAQQLRTFVATYPSLHLVVTSREPGFRAVAGAISSVSVPFRIAEFDEVEILALATAWHREVFGDTPAARQEATELTARIIGSDRVMRLARNPLLLTTLLLVKRWVGDLPRKRSALYGKAIEVLLMTWNVEGYEPIDLDEALPQLAYVAHAMTDDGVQQLTADRLTSLIQEAREQMPEILAYARIPVGAFVKRIEERSSVLSLVGHVLVDGSLKPVYEFKHLTFQEYLTARALAEGWNASAAEDGDLGKSLSPRFGDLTWREVIPLTAVLAGRRGRGIVERLIEFAGESPKLAGELLGSCLADEVQMPPETVRMACGPFAAQAGQREEELLDEVLASRYGATLKNFVIDEFIAGDDHALDAYDNAFEALARREPELWRSDAPGTFDPDRIIDWLAAEDTVRRAMAALAAMQAAWAASWDVTAVSAIEGGADLLPEVQTMTPIAVDLLSDESAAVRYCAAWAIGWMGIQGYFGDGSLRTSTLSRLFAIWRDDTTARNVREMAAWALSALPLVDRDSTPLGTPDGGTAAFLRDAWQEQRILSGPAVPVAGYYLRDPWPDDELRVLVKEQTSLALPGPDGLAQLLGVDDDASP